MTSAERDAAAELRLERNGPRPPPYERPFEAIRVTVENRETGRTTVVELLAPRGAPVTRYMLRVDGVDKWPSSKTAARNLVGTLMPPIPARRSDFWT